MRKYLVGLTALFALVVVTPVSAEGYFFYTGNDMMDRCKDTGTGEGVVNAAKYKACVVYLAGAMDAHETLVDWGRIPNRVICPSSGGILLEQLRQVFLNYMNAKPAKWHLSASGLALNAFREAWPCKE